MRYLLTISIALFCAITSPSIEANAATKLTKLEVQQVFIDRSWGNRHGTFLFRSNGTYTWKSADGSTTVNAKFTFKKDGSLKGNTTTYRFYKNTNGTYKYYHTRSRKYYKANLR